MITKVPLSDVDEKRRKSQKKSGRKSQQKSQDIHVAPTSHRGG